MGQIDSKIIDATGECPECHQYFNQSEYLCCPNCCYTPPVSDIPDIGHINLDQDPKFKQAFPDNRSKQRKGEKND